MFKQSCVEVHVAGFSIMECTWDIFAILPFTHHLPVIHLPSAERQSSITDKHLFAAALSLPSHYMQVEGGRMVDGERMANTPRDVLNVNEHVYTLVKMFTCGWNFGHSLVFIILSDLGNVYVI